MKSELPKPAAHFHLGGEDADCLDVWVVSRADADDFWDGNWMSCNVQVSAGGFRGRFVANLRTTEFSDFAEQVGVLHRDLKGTATFVAMEEQLLLTLAGDGRGHIHCNGTVRDTAGYGNVLKFELSLDQTHLARAMSQLAELLTRFPVRGSP
jgi:hypothetical protein